MATVTITPLPEFYRTIKRFRPMPPPVFTDGAPTPDDIELAQELFKELDPESQDWYRQTGRFRDL